MFPSSGAGRLIVLIRRAAAAAAGGASYRQAQSHAAQHYCSSAPLARTPDPDTVSYLVASCGLTPATAAVAAHRFRISSSAKADAVLALLRRHGFSDAHIVRMLRIEPRLVCLDPDTIIRPKLEFLAALGIQADAISRTDILCRSLDNHIAPRFEFLRAVLGSDANIRTAVSSTPYLLNYDSVIKLRAAVDTLSRHGLRESDISKLLTVKPSALRLTPSRIGEICKELEALGLPITHPRFAIAFMAMSSLKRENWQRKVALYQQHFGVSKSELLEAFKKHPMTMKLSFENIKEKFQFFMDELKLQPSDVMERPILISYSLEKSILPRCAVLSLLMTEGKIEREIDLRRPLTYTNKAFSDKYVLRYAENVPDVVKAYEGKIKFKGFRDQDV